MLHKLSVLIFASWLTGSLFAQEVISTQGDYFTASNGSLSWTLGEPVIATIGNGTNELTQGFQQTNLIVTSVNKVTNNIKVWLYPNPVINNLTINMEDNFKKGVYFNLMDNQGKLIKTAILKNTKSVVDFSSYAKGIYFLNVIDNQNKNLKTYKIIKQ